MNATEIEIANHFFDEYFQLLASFTVLFICLLYLWFVLVFGPEYMKKRDPYNVTDLIRLYNIFQVLACTFYVVRSHQMGFTLYYLWRCEKFEWFSELTKLEVKVGYWLFLCLRMVEFWETVFFIVRKKNKQASFLHIFHHIGSVAMTWLFIVADAELMAVYIAIVNSAVHMVMYTYYFFSSFKNEAIQKFTTLVKPLITIIQLVQFIIIIVHCVIAILPGCDCGYFFHLQILNFVVLFYLFSSFFVQSYVKKKKTSSDTNGNYEIAQA